VFGPSLDGIVGRRAGSAAGFPYSEALKNSGLVWTEDNLRKWIADSAQMIPNTLMPHVSISDPAEQIYLTAYLKTLKGSAAR
jgi:cytochrome c